MTFLAGITRVFKCWIYCTYALTLNVTLIDETDVFFSPICSFFIRSRSLCFFGEDD